MITRRNLINSSLLASIATLLPFSKSKEPNFKPGMLVGDKTDPTLKGIIRCVSIGIDEDGEWTSIQVKVPPEENSFNIKWYTDYAKRQTPHNNRIGPVFSDPIENLIAL